MKAELDPDEWIVINKSFFRYLIYVQWIPRLRVYYERIRYLLLEKIDPSPPGKRKENTDSWYSRIDYKYALRHARWTYREFEYLENLYEPLRSPEYSDSYSKRSHKILDPLVRIVGIRFYASKQKYQELLDKGKN